MINGALYRGVPFDRAHRNVLNFEDDYSRMQWLDNYFVSEFTANARIPASYLDIKASALSDQRTLYIGGEVNYIYMASDRREIFAFVDRIEEIAPATWRIFYTVDVWQSCANLWTRSGVDRVRVTPRLVDGVVTRSAALASAPLASDVPFVGEQLHGAPVMAFTGTYQTFTILAAITRKKTGTGQGADIFIDGPKLIVKSFTVSAGGAYDQAFNAACDFWTALCSRGYMLTEEGVSSRVYTYTVNDIVILPYSLGTIDLAPEYDWLIKEESDTQKVSYLSFGVLRHNHAEVSFSTNRQATRPDRSYYFGCLSTREKITGTGLAFTGKMVVYLNTTGAKVYYGISHEASSSINAAVMTDITSAFQAPILSDAYQKYLVENRDQLQAAEMSRGVSLALGLAGSAVALGAGIATVNPLAIAGGVLGAANTLAGGVSGITQNAASLQDKKNQPWSGGGFGNAFLNREGFAIWETEPGNAAEVAQRAETHGYTFTSPVDETTATAALFTVPESAPNYDYIQIADAEITGAISADDATELSNILARGVRVWYKTGAFLNGWTR